MRVFLLVLCLAWTSLAMATPASRPIADARPLQFSDRAEETRFRALTEQLRCVMCQNQSLADSNALIAQDLRREILGLMREGRNDAQIKQYLVARYTQFVLYQPQVGPSTWLLWFGPAALLLVGGAALVLVVRKHGRGAPPNAPEADSQEW
ncbi:MAG: cytochrome c-type biogenesis protein [Arenimonas sp.]